MIYTHSFSMDFVIIASFLIIFANIPRSNGSNNNAAELYNICSSVLYSCGNIKNLGYPFWGHDRPEFCGRKEFKLGCWANTPHAVIDSTNHWDVPVINITPSSNTLLVHEDNLSTCSKINNNQILAVTSPFKLSTSIGNLSLFSNCPTWVYKDQRCKKISCLSSDPNALPYGYCNFKKTQAETAHLSESCKARIEVPVMKSALDELNHGNGALENVFDKGFELEYTMTNLKDCSTCMNNGGTCGSSGTPAWKFICYYPEGIRNSARILRSGNG